MKRAPKKALIVGTYQPWIDMHLAALENLSIPSDTADPVKTVWEISETLRLKSQNTSYLKDYDLIIPLEEDYELLYYSLALDDSFGKARMLNKRSLLAYPGFSNKFHQYQLISKYSNLKMPLSYFSINPQQLASFVNSDETIAKILQSSRGRGVFKLSSPEELIQLNDEYGKRMLVQEFIATDPVHDYRTFILDGQSLGTIKRTASHGVTTNSSSKTEAVIDPPSIETMKKLALSLQLDFCGIDYILQVDGQPVILEVNRFPYFGNFVQATGVAIAPKVVNFLLTSRTHGEDL